MRALLNRSSVVVFRAFIPRRRVDYPATPLTAPEAEIISLGRTNVSILTRGWTRPDKLADEHI